MVEGAGCASRALSINQTAQRCATPQPSGVEGDGRAVPEHESIEGPQKNREHRYPRGIDREWSEEGVREGVSRGEKALLRGGSRSGKPRPHI